MSALERKQLKQAMAESRYMGHVEEEIRRNPSRGAGFYGGSSKGSTSAVKRGISHSYRVKLGVEMPSTGFDPHIFPSRKRTIKGMLSKEGMKKIGKAVSKFFIFKALPFNAVDSSPYMQSMIDTIAEVGPEVKGPSVYQIAMDRAKMAIKASVRKWEKYWEIIDDRWYRQLHRHLHAAGYFFNPVLQYSNTCVFEMAEVKRGVKEVIKRLEPDLIVQANAMNEIRLFVEKLGEFGSPLARQPVSTSLPDDDYYNPIDLNHIFHDNDILEEWTREAEEPLLPENNLDWLDEEGRMGNVQNDEDDDASLPLSRWSVQRSSKGKGKHVSSKEKGKQVTFKDKRAQISSSGRDKHILHCSSTQNDSDDETAEDDDNDDDDGDDDDDGGNDGGGNVHKDNQQSHGMTWAEGDENYYATQDTDHGYRPGIENQRRFLSNLTDYPSQDDDSQSQRYGRRQPDIQHSMQNLRIDEHRPRQLHGHQGSSIGTSSGRSNARRRNRGSAINSIGESNRHSNIESSHSSGTGTYSQGFDYYNQNMEHVMPHQPLLQVPYNIPYQGVFPQVPYGLPSQPVLYFPYGIPSHPAGVINVGSYTMLILRILHTITTGGLMVMMVMIILSPTGILLSFDYVRIS
ncbi:UNVERIFIED_CONTAM: hypothetical protein Slati_2173300 [Sesamum latifolium]|uniref:Uncharacterized protein n=1 Tax=Sesamum latifolium TaxID=2727402 RepID=A0AAW2WX14_9LAMI